MRRPWLFVLALVMIAAALSSGCATDDQKMAEQLETGLVAPVEAILEKNEGVTTALAAECAQLSATLELPWVSNAVDEDGDVEDQADALQKFCSGVKLPDTGGKPLPAAAASSADWEKLSEEQRAAGAETTMKAVAEALATMEPALRKASEATKDPLEELADRCLAVSMALEAPVVQEQIKKGGETRAVVKKLDKLCEYQPNLEKLKAAELEDQLKKAEEPVADDLPNSPW